MPQYPSKQGLRPAQTTTLDPVEQVLQAQLDAVEPNRPMVNWMMNSANPLSVKKAYLVTEGTSDLAPVKAPRIVAMQPQTWGEWCTHTNGYWVQNDLATDAVEGRQNNYRYEYRASEYPDGEFITANRFYSAGVPYLTRAWDSSVVVNEGTHYAAPADVWSRAAVDGEGSPNQGLGRANIVRQVNNVFACRDGVQGQSTLFSQNTAFDNCTGDAPVIGWPWSSDVQPTIGSLTPNWRDPINFQLFLDLEGDSTFPDLPDGDRQSLRPPMGQENFYVGFAFFRIFRAEDDEATFIRFGNTDEPTAPIILSSDFSSFTILGRWTFDWYANGHYNFTGQVVGSDTRVRPPVFADPVTVVYIGNDYLGNPYLSPAAEGIVSNANPTDPPDTTDPSVKGVATLNYGIYGDFTTYMDTTTNPGQVEFRTDRQYIIEAKPEGWNAPGLLENRKENRRLIEYRYYRAVRTR